MINSRLMVECLSSSELLASAKNLVDSCAGLEAELLLHLGEIDRRKLYLDRGCSSLFTFCVETYGFSEDITCSRIAVARAAHHFPAMLDSLRSGSVHLTGLRLLAPHLTPENHRDVLARAAGKSKREIEELVACLSPQPPVPTAVRKLPERSGATSEAPQPLTLAPAPRDPPAGSEMPPEVSASSRGGAPLQHRPVIAPLSEATFKIQFTASRSFRDKLRQAQELLRHRVRDGDPAAILESALDLLIEQVKKDRFAVGRKPRQPSSARTDGPISRHIPNAIKREVFERDKGRCTFVGETGRRCSEMGAVEFDHVDGFARNRAHDAARLRLLCSAHNQREAERMYGLAFMKQKRSSNRVIRPGADSQPSLFSDPTTQASVGSPSG